MSGHKLQLGLLAAPGGWHFEDLCRAARGRRGITVVPRQFEQLTAAVELGQRPTEIDDDTLLVRAMPAGSLEQVVFRMDALWAASRAGVHVVNAPKAIEASVDKYLSLVKLHRAGVDVPRTRVSQTAEQARQHWLELGSDTVLKPIFGSLGTGLARVQSESGARHEFEARIAEGRVIYQQEFVPHGGQDLRLLVIGERVVGMRRTHRDSWITNVHQGGTAAGYQPSTCEQELARRACAAVGASIAGVDLVWSPDLNRPLVLEINSSPGWQALARVSGTDVAAEILNFLCASAPPARSDRSHFRHNSFKR